MAEERPGGGGRQRVTGGARRKTRGPADPGTRGEGAWTSEEVKGTSYGEQTTVCTGWGGKPRVDV